MFSIFWKSLFSSLLIFFLFSNIAFTFDMVHLVNPAALVLSGGDSYSNYYFGVSSFIDAFKTWFGNNSALSGFSQVMVGFGKTFSQSINIFERALNVRQSMSATGGIIRYIIAIFLWLNSALPLFFGISYIVMFIIYILFLVFQIGAFVIYWFGGGFMTPLPDTSWWDTGHFPTETSLINSLRAYMV